METKNIRSREALSSFIQYCVTHPHERFWQALRNWSGYHYIIARTVTGYDVWDDETVKDTDTYNWEGLDNIKRDTWQTRKQTIKRT